MQSLRSGELVRIPFQYMLMSCGDKKGQNDAIKIANNIFENESKFNIRGRHKEIKIV